MKRLVALVSSLVACASVATLIAAVTGAVYLRTSGRLDNAKIERLLAVLQGTEPLAPPGDAAKPVKRDEEQTSYDERGRAAALQLRQLEMREQSVKNGVAEIRDRQKELDEQRSRYEIIRDAFRKELADVRSGVNSAGLNNVMQTLVNIKPKQAKEQLMQMIKGQEMDDVVTILSLMPLDNRAKIVSEFKSAEESKMLDDILRRIRQARSENELVDKTEDTIQKPQ